MEENTSDATKDDVPPSLAALSPQDRQQVMETKTSLAEHVTDMRDMERPDALQPIDTPGYETQVLPPPQSVEDMSPEAKQQLQDVQAELSGDIVGVRDTGAPTPQPQADLANKQWTFERSEVAQDIQRTNDMPSPGE